MSPEDLLRANGVALPSYAPGRYATTCPRCSAGRHSVANRNAQVLGVTLERDRAFGGCNHCGWTFPQRGNGNGRDHDPPPDYLYRDASGELRAGKVRNKPGRKPRFIFKYWDGATWISADENSKRAIRITIPLLY